MEYCMNHPDEISKLSKLKAQITEVKGIMMDNIEKVMSFENYSGGKLYHMVVELLLLVF